MKKILKKYSLAATLMAILCLLPASCITDDAPAATEKATVTITEAAYWIMSRCGLCM